MEQYFPADVSLRVTGEIGDAQKLFPVARQLLSRAMRLKETGQPLVRMFIPGNDGSLVFVRLHQNLKHVYVQPGKKGVRREEKEVVELKEGVGVAIFMLSGLVRPGTLVDDAAHEFHPTQVCSNAYGLEYVYQDMPKLGLSSNVSSGKVEAYAPKPSMYSGAMKRVVQALYGIGKIGDDLSGEEVTEIRNLYRHDFLVTHGIYRIGQNVWLIEISRDRGVLKMPLPIIEGTEADTFLETLEGWEDTDTAKVVSEFGGLPSGLTFPVNDPAADPPNALDLAIEAGEVFRLATADNLKPFYVDPATSIIKKSLFAGCGWAFSDSGQVGAVHNTCFWYKNEGFATILDTARAPYELLEAHVDYPSALVAPIEDRAMAAEHWQISIDGASSTLSLVEKSYLAGPQKTVFSVGFDSGGIPVSDFKDTEMLRVQASIDSDSLAQLGIWGRPPTGYKLTYEGRGQIATYLNYDCPILVFFMGDVLETVRHQPERTYSGALVSYSHPQDTTHAPGGGSFFNTPDVIHTFTAEGQTCTSSDYDPFTRYGSSVPPGTYAYRESSFTATDFAIDTFYGGDFIGCSGDGGSTDLVEDVIEYSAIIDELRSSEGEQSDSAPLYGYLQPQWGGTPFKLHYVTSDTRHRKVVEIGHGENSSIGHVEEDIFTSHGTYTLITGVQYAPDIEGFVYNKEVVINGVSSDAGYHISSISEISPNVWRRSGAFYSTSLDLRRNELWSYLYLYADPIGYYVITAADWESKIGLTIPAFVREGYAFVKWDGGVQYTFGSGAGITGSTQLPEKRTTYLVAPGLTTGYLTGNPVNIVKSQWDKLVNAFNFKYGASVNAGPTKCGILQADIYGDLIIPGLLSEVLTPPQSFTGSAGGIPITDCTSENSTFVGAV